MTPPPLSAVLHVSPVHDAGIESGRGRVGALVLAVDPADPDSVGMSLESGRGRTIFLSTTRSW